MDENGKPLEALGEPFAKAITGDVLAEEASWQKPLEALRGKLVRLEPLTLKDDVARAVVVLDPAEVVENG